MKRKRFLAVIGEGVFFEVKSFSRTVRRVNRIKALVGTHVSLAQIALRFCLSHPAITAAIPGVQSAEQVRCNLAVLDQGPLPQELLDQLTMLWQEDFSHLSAQVLVKEGEGEGRKARLTSTGRKRE